MACDRGRVHGSERRLRPREHERVDQALRRLDLIRAAGHLKQPVLLAAARPVHLDARARDVANLVDVRPALGLKER